MSTGLFVAFATPQGLDSALRALRAARVGTIETFTPTPVETGPSVLPVLVLIGGVLGAVAGFLLQTYADVSAYPLDIGGRPFFSWPAFVPIAFENGVLAAIMTGFVGYFVVNGLPTLYRQVDEFETIRRAMRDLWCLAIRTDDPDRARQVLLDHAPERIEELRP